MLTQKLTKFFFLFLLGATFFTCKKNFLATNPIGTLDPTTLADEKGVNKILIGAYAMLDNYDPGIEFNQFGASASNSLFAELEGAPPIRVATFPIRVVSILLLSDMKQIR